MNYNNYMLKKVLIFYSKTGGGHFRAAEALKQHFEELDPSFTISLRDGLEQLNFGLKTNPASNYTLVSNEFINFYNLLYRSSNTGIGVRFLRKIAKGIWGHSLKGIIKEEEPDLVVSTHPFISPSTIFGKINIPFITVVTDLGLPHRIWFDIKADKIITPTKEMALYGNKFIHSDKTIVIDYPLKKEFDKKVTSKGFTDRLLLLGGGTGAGNLKSQAQILLANFPEKTIVVVCGHNSSLQNTLRKLKGIRLQTFGFVNNIADLISGADIVITKAGPGTIAEAATFQKPLIITSWVGLQEKDNINFVVENQLGLYIPNLKDLPTAVTEVYQNYSKYSQGQNFFSKGSQKITKYILHEYLPRPSNS
jgi:1,2-diacylglycerol 3-beta-galactosyltransferase